MRKTAFLLLLATVATPSFAQDRGDDRESRREAARAERAERAEAREERRDDRPQRAEQAAPEQVRVERDRGDRAAVREERREAVQQRQVDRRGGNFDAGPAQVNVEQRRQAINDRRDLRQERRVDRRADRRAPPIVSNVPREGTQPPPVAASGRPSTSHRWNGSWRNDRRYDWNNWRNRHRSLFRLGFYYDPFGWGYRPYSIGWRLWPSYYRSNYWLNDPWMYRLPPAYPGTRWIRYYNDALLVDTWTGEVVDVIYSFFW